MKVAVVGGTGVLGAPLVAELAARGDEVRVLSRGAPKNPPAGVSHRPVDLISGEGLAEALAEVEVVVDAANSTAKPGEVLAEGTRRLLRAGADAGVRHHIGVSIVGCDRVPLAYYKVKVEQEAAIAAGEVPWSLLRATQFHTLIAWAFGQAGRFGVVPTGSARLQPIHPPVVAARLAEVAHAEPAGRLPDVAGPEVQTLSELARAWRGAGHRALPLRIPMVGRIGRPLSEGALCNPAAASDGPSFERWLADG
ncbi:MAG TPA: NAD(P)H-binding protein [Solirubrobacterales bacterium]|nr:NAD(P)H-binding protein [Solirubrobacterales bacterium]